MSKDIKNTKSDVISRIKIPGIILLIIFISYALMAVVNHLSLNIEAENYRFSQSLSAIFNTQTSIFKFFLLFISVFGIWISGAFIIKRVYSFFIKRSK